MRQNGQIIIMLLLVMILALAIGLSLVQNSLTDITNSTAADQSSRAFSAAESGIEQALVQTFSSNTTFSVTNLGSNSKAQVSVFPNLPSTLNQALEYPPLSKADFAHFWLANPSGIVLNGTLTTTATDYTDASFDLFFGDPCYLIPSTCPNPADSMPAVEVNVVTYNSATTTYSSNKFYYDSDNIRAPTRGFNICTNRPFTVADTTLGKQRSFLCRVVVSGYTGKPVLARIRVLYSLERQSVAAANRAGGVRNFPSQAILYRSSGIVGNTERRLTVFRESFVAPYFLDFALFSTTDIVK